MKIPIGGGGGDDNDDDEQQPQKLFLFNKRILLHFELQVHLSKCSTPPREREKKRNGSFSKGIWYIFFFIILICQYTSWGMPANQSEFAVCLPFSLTISLRYGLFHHHRHHHNIGMVWAIWFDIYTHTCTHIERERKRMKKSTRFVNEQSNLYIQFGLNRLIILLAR